jgi:hypothetical protein
MARKLPRSRRRTPGIHDSRYLTRFAVAYSKRIATVEPVFANIRHTKRLDRFTLRGKEKVGTQWRLYCLVHNIEKLTRSR